MNGAGQAVARRQPARYSIAADGNFAAGATMSGHGYESGRLDLPFVGICTFGKSPLCLDWDDIDADVAVLGAPFDFGTQWRAGARFGPRSVREASTLFSFGLRALWKLRLTTFPTPELNFLRFVHMVDGSRAERVLGYRPTYSLRETIRAVAAQPG